MIDYSKVSQYEEVIELIKKREQIEKEIMTIDEIALVEYELQKLQLDEVIEEEKTIPVTIATIKNTCGWSKYCDITDANHYMLKEWNVADSEIREVKLSHAKELGLCH